MRTILVPIDGSESSARAVKAAIKACSELGGATLHLLTVHPPIASGNVKRFFSVEALDDFYQDEGRKTLVPAKALLDQAGIAYTDKIAVGPVAQTIAEYAAKNQCDTIIMGTRGLGAMTSFVLGSVATKVLSLVDIPVTLIK